MTTLHLFHRWFSLPLLTSFLKIQEYFTYLDDGVSRDSAPEDLPQYKETHEQSKAEGAEIAKLVGKKKGYNISGTDPEAKGYHRQVAITQVMPPPHIVSLPDIMLIFLFLLQRRQKIRPVLSLLSRNTMDTTLPKRWVIIIPSFFGTHRVSMAALSM